MKGIILAGGLGTRLHPLTKVTNKCLLPVYNKPMIYYPIQLMVDAGIDEILLICGGNSLGDFLPLLGNGEEFGLKGLTYRVQSEPRGIADALSLAEHWTDNDNICVLLSDNIFEDSIKNAVDQFESGAQVFLSKVEHPEHYGVAEIAENDQVISIVEKPTNSKSDWAVTGLYIYDNSVWDFIKTLEPSARGELEITDVNNYYLREGKLQARKLSGWWADCGENFDGYLDACNKVKSWQENDEFPSDDCATLVENNPSFTDLKIYYANQYIDGEKLENRCLNQNIVTYDHITRNPAMYVTGTIFHNDFAIQTFAIDDKGDFTFKEIEDNIEPLSVKKGYIDFNLGEITLVWNTSNPGSTYLIVSYEYEVK